MDGFQWGGNRVRSNERRGLAGSEPRFSMRGANNSYSTHRLKSDAFREPKPCDPLRNNPNTLSNSAAICAERDLSISDQRQALEISYENEKRTNRAFDKIGIGDVRFGSFLYDLLNLFHLRIQ